MTTSYFSVSESKKYSYFCIPKVMLSSPELKSISCEAKLLYGIMLDRMSLSVENNWADKDGKTFILFTIEETMDTLCCGKSKAMATMAELDGIGLIERVRQGQGNANRIYVKNFTLDCEHQKSEKQTSETTYIAAQTVEPSAFAMETSDNQASRGLKNKPQEVSKTAPNNTDINNTYVVIPDIYPIHHAQENWWDGMDGLSVEREIKSRVQFDLLMGCVLTDDERSRAQELVTIMTEVLLIQKKKIRVNGEDLPSMFVKRRIGEYNMGHFLYVFHALKQNVSPVRNIRAYIITALYNAPVTYAHSLQAQENAERALEDCV